MPITLIMLTVKMDIALALKSEQNTAFLMGQYYLLLLRFLYTQLLTLLLIYFCLVKQYKVYFVHKVKNTNFSSYNMFICGYFGMDFISLKIQIFKNISINIFTFFR